MDKRILVSLGFLIALFSISSVAYAQVQTKNNTAQAPNYDFETWDNPEPWGWNSSSCFDFPSFESVFASSVKRNQTVWAYAGGRPGTKGAQCAKVQVTKSTWFYWGNHSEVFGTLTTGTIYINGDSKTDGESCIYTKTDDGSKNWPFSGRPDSIVFWAKMDYNGGRNADMTLYLHSNGQLEDRNPNGTANATVIGSANVKMTYNGGQWVRYSVPISYASEESPAYLLLSFTAGNNFREVVENDVLYVDDVMLIYNPSLSINSEMPTEIVRHGSQNLQFSIPFTITGTMSPFNLLPDNEVIAYLSDADGNWENALELGRITTDESGQIDVNLPSDFPDSDKYRLKLVSTNYPLESQIVDLKIYRQWNLTVSANNSYGSVSPEATTACRHLSTQTLSAVPNADCAFLYWMSDGQIVSEDAQYTFTMDGDKAFTACFDTTYTLQFASVTGANVYFANNNGQTLTYLPGDTVQLRTQLDYGYDFSGYRLNGNLYSPDSLQVDLLLREGGIIEALVDSIEYDYVFEVYPDAKLAAVSGSGKHKHFSTVEAVAAAANPYAHFVRWEDTAGVVVGLDTVLRFENISGGGHYRAVFDEETHSVGIVSQTPSWGNVLQCGSPVSDSVYSAFDLTRIEISAVPEEGYAFSYWEILADGISTERSENNPYILTDNAHLTQDYHFVAVFDTLYHTLTVEAEHGKVSGAGVYHYRQQATIVAKAEDGYHFSHWESGAVHLGENDTLQITVDRDTVLYAVFEINVYPVEVKVSDTALGEVNLASGEYAHFSRLDFSAQAVADAELRYWVLDGDTVGTDDAYSVTVSGPFTIEAIFSRARRQVSLVSAEENFGTTSGSGIYEWGDTVYVEALAFPGYHFTHWEDPQKRTLTENPIRIDSITSDTVLTAHFSPDSFHLLLLSEGEGNVYLNDTLQDLQEADFLYLDQVSLWAVPYSESYEFVGWYDLSGRLLSTKNPERISVRNDTVIQARFSERRYTVAVSCEPSGAGLWQGDGSYLMGESVSLQAQARNGYAFEGWYRDGVLLTDQAAYTFTVEGETYLMARFTPLEYDLSIAVFPDEAAVSFSGEGTFRYGFNTRLYVQPAWGYELGAWVDDRGDTVGQTNPCLYDVERHANIEARMVPALLHVDYSCLPYSWSGKVEASECRFGQHTSVLAVPNHGYRFSAWQNARGEEIGTENPLVFSTEKDTSFVARFDRDLFHVEVYGNNGSLQDSGNYLYRDTCRIEAVPDEGYEFQGWYDSRGSLLSLRPQWSFVVNGDSSLYARFRPVSVQVSLVCEPEQGGMIFKGDERQGGYFSASYGQILELQAVPASGMRFVRWETDGSESGSSLSQAMLSVRVEGNEQIKAVFEPESFALEIEMLSDLSTGTVSGAGEYLYGSPVVLSAEPAPHYRFESYGINGNPVSYDPDYAFVMDSSLTVQVRFVPQDYMLNVHSAQPEQGQASGSGVYAYGQEVAVSAWSISPSCRFSHWSSDPEGRDTLGKEALWQDYPMQDIPDIYAQFTRAEVSLTLVSDLVGAELSGSGTYRWGDEVRYSAVAPEGYHFVAWCENGVRVSIEPAGEIMLDGNREWKAVFAPDTVNLVLKSVSSDTGVSLLGQGSYLWGETVHVRVENLPENYRFVAWKDPEGKTISSQSDFSTVMKADACWTAEWETAYFDLEIEVEGKGTVQGAGRYASGSEAVLVARAGDGNSFLGWYRDQNCLGLGDTLHIAVMDDMKATARFGIETVEIVPGVNRGDGGAVTFPQRTSDEDSVVLHARLETGYRFLYWTQGDSLVSTEISVKVPTRIASQVLAHFEPLSYRLDIKASIPEGVSEIYGFGTYKQGDISQLSIVLREGYVFDGWYRVDGGRNELISDQTAFDLSVESSASIEARVSKQQ